MSLYILTGTDTHKLKGDSKMNDLQLNQAEMLLGVMKRDYPELKKIYEKAINAEFINVNSSNAGEPALYKTIVNNQKLMKRYFMIIGYELCMENGYCYFIGTIDSEKDEQVSAEDKKEIRDLVQCLQIFALFKNINNNFGVVKDFQFNISNIEMAINDNAEYRAMISLNEKSENSYRKYIERQVNILKNNGYLEEINKKEGKYKTLNSLDYLIRKAELIDIREEDYE